MHAHVDLGLREGRRRLEVFAIVFHYCRPFIHGNSKEMGVGKGQPQLGGHVRAFVPGAQQPNVRHFRFPWPGADAGEKMAIFQVVVQEAE